MGALRDDLFAFAALTVGDFQFKAIARATYQEDELAHFFTYFYAGTGIVSLIFQVLATPRLLARFGVERGRSVMPAVFGAASAVLLFVPHLGVATIMKFSDNGFQYTIHETTLQALYVPFAARVKARTRAFLDAVVKPLSYGAGGGLLILLAHSLPTAALSYVSAVLVVGWVLSDPDRATPLSQGARANSLGTGCSGRARRSARPRRRWAAGAHGRSRLARRREHARRAGRARRGASRPFRSPALGRPPAPSVSVRIAAMTSIAKRGAEARRLALDITPLRAALDDALPEVRAAAAAALAALALDDANDALVSLLDDDARSVRAAALAALLTHGGLDGAMTGGSSSALAHALHHRTTERTPRLASSGRPATDPCASSSRGSGRAGEAHRGPRGARLSRPTPTSTSVAALHDPQTERAAVTALAQIGSPAAPRLVALLG